MHLERRQQCSERVNVFKPNNLHFMHTNHSRRNPRLPYSFSDPVPVLHSPYRISSGKSLLLLFYFLANYYPNQKPKIKPNRAEELTDTNLWAKFTAFKRRASFAFSWVEYRKRQASNFINRLAQRSSNM